MIKSKLKKTKLYCILKKIRHIKKLKLQEKNKKLTLEQIEKKIDKDYYKINGRHINWDNPASYTEKLNVSKLYNSNDKKTKLSDKIEVRAWVEEKIGREYLIPLLGVYEKFEDIDFEKLPNKFVMKCNHDSGSVTICNDKSKINFRQKKDDYNFYLKRNMAYYNFEKHYEKIKPKIIIEKNMGNNIKDFKFLCFDGIPYYCWVDSDRFENHKRNVYDMEWNLQDFNQMTYGTYNEEIKKPQKFDRMKEIARILSEGFDHVRVDLYEIDGEIYFGEMTFTNGNGMECITPDDYDYYLGKLWKNFKSQRSK